MAHTNKTWVITDVQEGVLIDEPELLYAKEYDSIERRLEKTKPPACLWLKIEPVDGNTYDHKATAEKAKRQFIRHFTVKYCEGYIIAQSKKKIDGWWVLVMRGPRWYHPELHGSTPD